MTKIFTDGTNRITVADDATEADFPGYTEEGVDLDSLAAQVRGTRDTILGATDHYALSDVTMSAAIGVYRQALRDVPSQAGFPKTIVWPTKPGEIF